MSKSFQNREKLYMLVLTTLFAAVILLLAFTPLGLINLPFIKATVLHVPVIIGSVILGPRRGAILGFIFGLSSFIVNTVTPSALSFAFSPLIPVLGSDRGSVLALVICFAPRILTGITPYYIFSGLSRLFKKRNAAEQTFSYAAAAVAGALTNTILVMGLIFIIFRQEYAAMKSVSADAVFGLILGVIAANGGPEALLAAILTPPVCMAAKKLMNKKI